MLLLATPVFAQEGAIQFLERLGFADILLWLLTFAIVYGVLSRFTNILSNASSAIIAIVVGFFVLLATPTAMIAIIEQMSTGLVLVVLAVLGFIVFLEVAGVRFIERKKGKEGEELVPVTFFQKYSYVSAIALFLIAVLIFIGAGGLELIGFVNLPTFNITGIIFFIVVIIAVIWLIAEKPPQ